MRRPRCSLLLFVLLEALFGSSYAGDLGAALDAMVGRLHNETPPALHLDARRGVLSGGSLSLRQPLTTVQPLSASPPSYGAGCGGIDLYGGSFSFINQSQFSSLLRAIAGNAGGYAFQLGINAMCPDCGSLMSDLQRKLQSMNELFSNSCQLAQGVVHNGLSALQQQNQTRASALSLEKGLGDVFESWTGQASGGALSSTYRHDPEGFKATLSGNLAWRALKSAQAARWYPLGEDSFLEGMMSLTGSVVIGIPTPARDGQGVSLPITRLPPLIDLDALVDGPRGSPLRTYRCDTSDREGCLSPRIEPLTDQGLARRLEVLLLGPEGHSGLVEKFRSGDGQLTREELAFLSLAPGDVGALIRNLSREDAGLAHHFAKKAAGVLALDLAASAIDELLSSLREAALLTENPFGAPFDKALEAVEQRLERQRAHRQQREGTPLELVHQYTALRHSARSTQVRPDGEPPLLSPP